MMQWTILAVTSILMGCHSQHGAVDRTQFLSSIAIKVSATNIGNIIATTPFSVQAIRKAFPGYDITKKMHSTEGEAYPVISVSQGNETLLIVNPSENKMHIYSVIVESPKVSPYMGYSIGMQYKKIQADIVPGRCSPGLEELSGMVICPAKSASSITYIFSGHWSGPDGELPPQQILNSWRLSKLVWLATIVDSTNFNTRGMQNGN